MKCTHEEYTEGCTNCRLDLLEELDLKDRLEAIEELGKPIGRALDKKIEEALDDFYESSELEDKIEERINSYDFADSTEFNRAVENIVEEVIEEPLRDARQEMESQLGDALDPLESKIADLVRQQLARDLRDTRLDSSFMARLRWLFGGTR